MFIVLVRITSKRPTSNSASSIEEDFIKMKHSSHSKKKHAGVSQKDKSLGTSHPPITSNPSKNLVKLMA